MPIAKTKVTDIRAVETKALVDTNILLSLVDARRADPEILLNNMLDQYDPCICFQNIAEFWVVATRPASVNGLGLNTPEVAQRIRLFRQIFTLVSETPDTVDTWLSLCCENNIAGKRAHDIRLAALAISNNISTLLTGNPADFTNLRTLSIVNPLNEITGSNP